MKRFSVCALCLLLLLSFFATDNQASAYDHITFHNQREYELKIAKLTLPDDFVYPTRFHTLGTLTRGSIDITDPITCYYYFTSDLSVRIEYSLDDLYYNTYFGPGYLTEIPEGTHNMLFMENPNDSGEAFCYFRNGLYYAYRRDGGLDRMYWISGNIYFTLDIPDFQNSHLVDSSRYPIPAQLLSATEEVADSAFQSLCDELGITPDRNHYTKRYELPDRIAKAVFLIGIPGIIFISWLIAKRRQKKGIVTYRRQPRHKDDPPFSAFVNHESPFDTPNTH